MDGYFLNSINRKSHILIYESKYKIMFICGTVKCTWLFPLEVDAKFEWFDLFVEDILIQNHICKVTMYNNCVQRLMHVVMVQQSNTTHHSNFKKFI